MREDTPVRETSLAEWVQLVRAEYLEIPDLNLTQPQVERLWNLDIPTTEALLKTLVDARFLRRTRSGGYVRTDGGR
jgi:hypothetical protein